MIVSKPPLYWITPYVQRPALALGGRHNSSLQKRLQDPRHPMTRHKPSATCHMHKRSSTTMPSVCHNLVSAALRIQEFMRNGDRRKWNSATCSATQEIHGALNACCDHEHPCPRSSGEHDHASGMSAIYADGRLKFCSRAQGHRQEIQRACLSDHLPLV